MKYKILLLFVVLLFSVSASFAVLETDINDPQNDVNDIGEVNNTYSVKEKGEINLKQLEWYDRNYESLGIPNYLLKHPYFDGANVDLPEDPFPYKDTDFRFIVFSKDPGFCLEFESLSKFLTPEYQRALAENNIDFHFVNVFRSGGNSDSTNNPLELVDDSNSPVVENINTTNNTPVVSAGMESTGFPIVALILAVLVSIVAFRRKE